MRLKKLILALAILLLTANLAAAKPGVVSETLPNGAKVYVLEDNNSPLVAIQIWIKTGAVHESYKTRGMSHFLEHLLFKGTQKRQVGEIDRELDSIGATNNAATYYDYTFYQATGASCHFDKMLEIEVDGVLNSALRPEEVEKERKVVIEEIKMGEDSPYRVMFKSIHKGLFDNLNYAYPVIGYEEVIQNVPRDVIYQYYKEKYHPKNMSFVIVGNIKPEIAIAKVKDALKNITTEYAPNEWLDSTYESRLEKPRYEKIAMDTEKSYAAIASRGVSASSDDAPAFEVMSDILSAGTSSRLNLLLKEKNKLVESISCANWNFASSGAFVAFMIMDLKNFDKARELFFNEIENVKKGAITDEELIKAKNQIETAFVLAHQNYEGMAEFLGETVTISNIEKYNTFMDRIKKVKKEDVVACANKYLKPKSHLVVVIEPKKAAKKTEVGKLEKK